LFRELIVRFLFCIWIYLIGVLFQCPLFAGSLYVQPDTPEYYELCEAAKTEVWGRIYEEKEQFFLNFVDECSEIISSMDSIMFSKMFQEEWEQHFRDTQLSWLQQLAKDRSEYCYSESALGGNHHDREATRYAIAEIDKRVSKLKSRWWFLEKN
jgi:hypothetical protein